LIGFALLLAALLLLRVLLIENTHALHQQVFTAQRQLAELESSRPLLQAIVTRLRQGVEQEPDLADLLRQYAFEVEARP